MSMIVWYFSSHLRWHQDQKLLKLRRKNSQIEKLKMLPKINKTYRIS